LNKEIAERLEEINTIKDELNIFKTKEWKKLNTKRMAEYLYENHRDHYDRYISSRRYAVIQWIEKDVKKYERVYEKIPVLSRFYKMIVKLAS
jgi:hypothetical protein